MAKDIYEDIAKRTGGDIYIGVVGPVRTGKSTLIKQLMEKLVIPNIPEESKRLRAVDELPQSAAGKTIMTTEPKFVPKQAAKIQFPNKETGRIRLIDCVGFMVPGAVGSLDLEERMVRTPWSEEEMEFSKAAAIGTRKVIHDHANIGIVLTTDGTFGELKRKDYEEAEARIVEECEMAGKPFVILLNTARPGAPETKALCTELKERYKKNVVAMVALGVIVFLFLFAFVGPLLIPYGYDEFNKGAENLYPYHYTLEDTQRVNDEIASRTQSDVVDVDEMIAQAKAEAEKKGEKFTKKDEAVIRAKAKVAAKPSEDSSEEQSVDEDSVRKELGIKKHIFGYSQAELERKANGEKVFPHVFGTDMYGRDILVRVMYGARVSMSVGVFAAILVLVIGALYGAISGYCGGKVDAVMQRIVELIYAVPEMLVVLLIATALKPILTDYVNSSGTSPLKSFVNVLGPNLISMFIAFGLLYWVTMSRIIRGQVLQLKQQEYVTAARALGASGGRIIRRHLLPNCIGQIVVTTCLQIPSAIFLESFLSYLGVGVSAPLPSLGSMATDALSGMYTYTYRLIVPSVILSIMILAFNLFGDGLRDALDPKLKK